MGIPGILGVELSFNIFVNNTLLLSLHIRVLNTAQTSEELDEEVKTVLRHGSTLMSRTGALFLRALELRAAGIKRARVLSDEEVFTLDIKMLNAPPGSSVWMQPYWVFTDASAEDSIDDDKQQKVVIRGILTYFVLPRRSCSKVAFLTQVAVSARRRDAPVQVIAQAETFVVVVAKAVWQRALVSQKVILAGCKPSFA
eukprot:6464069-Amphidinium_carterae.1